MINQTNHKVTKKKQKLQKFRLTPINPHNIFQIHHVIPNKMTAEENFKKSTKEGMITARSMIRKDLSLPKKYKTPLPPGLKKDNKRFNRHDRL